MNFKWLFVLCLFSNNSFSLNELSVFEVNKMNFFTDIRKLDVNSRHTSLKKAENFLEFEKISQFIREENIDKIFKHLRSNPFIARQIDLFRNSLIHVALINKKDSFVKLLLDFFKIKNNNGNLVNFLNLINLKGLSPLHIAVRNGNLQSVLLLLQNGADPFLQTSNNKTSFEIAAKFGFADILCYLFEITNLKDDSILISLIREIPFKKNVDVAKVILKQSKGLILKDESNNNPLHILARVVIPLNTQDQFSEENYEKLIEIISLFINAGYSITEKNDLGVTPYDVSLTNFQFPKLKNFFEQYL